MAVDKTRVLVVGGGVAGLGTAAALAGEARGGLVLLEAETMLGTGSTARSLGGFRYQFADPVLAELSARAIPKLERLQAEPEADIGFARSGYLFVGTTEEDERTLLAQVEGAASVGVQVEILRGAEIARPLPGLRTDDLRLGAWGPLDGQVDPHQLTQTWARKVRAAGAQIRTRAEVLALDVQDGRVTGVQTAEGRIDADVVVLAAGPRSAALAKDAGVELPLVNAHRHLFFAEGPDVPRGNGPLVMSLTPQVYFRLEATGIVASARELIPERASMDNWPELMERCMERSVARLPQLEHAGWRKAWSGVQTIPEDGRPIVGPAPGLDGLVLVAGLSGHGVMHSPALGRIAADWVLGRAPDDLARALDPRRLTASSLARATST